MATVADNLVRALARHMQVDVLNTVKTTPPDRSLWQGVRAQASLLWRLGALVLVRRPRVVHIHTCSFNSFWRNGLDVLVVKALFGKVILHIHGAQFHEFLAALSPGRQRLARTVFALADKVIVLGENWRRVLEPWAGARLVVLPNAVPLPEGPMGHEPGQGDAPPVVITLANYERRKGQADLIRARARLDQDCPLVVRLYGADGEPGERERLEALVAEQGLAGKVEVNGPVTGQEKDQVFAAASGFCLPSYNEGLPMAMLEAMSYGLPVLVTEVGSIPEVIHDGVNGMLFAPGQEDRLAARLRRFCTDGAALRAMGQAARATVVADYSLDSNAEKLAAIYDEVAP
ncbi:MAG: glycosyltransferase family 4 protein [Gammaproteobacteria bacterium]|nr:glycosyltransferase family 4 protein [Gammaproteobacteria bacterium]